MWHGNGILGIFFSPPFSRCCCTNPLAETYLKNFQSIRDALGVLLRKEVSAPATGNLLRRCRVARGVTGRTAARLLGVSYRQYQRYEASTIDDAPDHVYIALVLGALERGITVEESKKLLWLKVRN